MIELSFSKKVEFLARKACEELGYPLTDIEHREVYINFINSFKEQLVSDAFHKIRGKYWNNEIVIEELKQIEDKSE